MALTLLLCPGGEALAQGAGMRASLGRQGFITTWLVLGPFPYATPRRADDKWGIDIDFLAGEGGETKAQPVRGAKVKAAPAPAPAEAGGADGAAGGAAPATPGATGASGDPPAWMPVVSDSPYVNLDKAMKPNDNVVAYAAVYLMSSHSQELFLKIGSDDGARAWLNGEMVHDHPRPRAAVIDDDTMRVKLKAGANLLIVKVEERRGAWGFYVRLQDDLRRRPPGVSLLLPGSGFEMQELAKQLFTTSVPREVLADGAILKPEVRIEVGYPAWGANLWARATLRHAYNGRVYAQSGVQGTSLGVMGRHRTQFALPMRTVPDGDYMLRIEVGQQGQPAFYSDDTRVPMRKAVYVELDRARRTLNEAVARLGSPPVLRGRGWAASRSAIDSITWGIEHLTSLLQEGDRDNDYLEREARRSVRLAEALGRREDPYFVERGPFHRAYRSPIDGRLQKYAVHVPKDYDPSRRYPLLVALHGLTGEVMMAVRVALGVDQRPDEPTWKALRHLPPLPETGWIVVAPYGYGDIAYRGIGTEDVLRAIDEVKTTYSIDDDRVVLSGWSMGGIGVFEIGMRHADQFSALIALCGYGDVGLYGSAFARRRPFERPLFEGERGVNYAENGRNIPLFVIHGTHDNPRHSLGFIDRYTELGYKLSAELPEAGHNVWSYAFEQQYLLRKVAGFRRMRWPRQVTLKAYGYRHRALYWVRIDEIEDLTRFGRIDTDVKDGNVLEVKTENVSRLHLAPGGGLLDVRRPIVLRVNGAPVPVPAIVPDASGRLQIALSRQGGSWKVDGSARAGTVQPVAATQAASPSPPGTVSPATAAGAGAAASFPPPKGPGISGPLLDTLYSHSLVVYGTQGDAGDRDTMKRVAEELARYSRRARVHLPLKKDSEVTDKDMRERHLVLVGRPDQNLIVSRVADRLPLKIGKREIEVGKRTYRGRHLGTALVYPNPLAPMSTLTVVAGTSGPALFDVVNLPRLQPDYIVWDRRLAKDSGGFFLGKEREVLEAGYFDRSWRLPDRPYRGPRQ